MRVGVLTSSRADYGIYLPLLQKMKLDNDFEIEIIAFGTHLSKFHGYTLHEIQKENFKVIHTISSLITNDDEQSISTAYGLTVLKFADFWCINKFDWVFCLGDRFEMSAAVQAGIPFGIKFAHIHGGETTLGAIDNIYRHQITLASTLHFTATETAKNRVIELISNAQHVYNVGSLSLDEIKDFKLLEKEDFLKQFSIPNQVFALVTFQPETVVGEDNIIYAQAMKEALIETANYINLVITMPNADTFGIVYREAKLAIKAEHPNKVVVVENFGKKNYFSAMKYAKFLIGNTSSGIIEAASFGKYVVNVGNRQEGREQSQNVLNCTFDKISIINSVKQALKLGNYDANNVYYQSNVACKMIQILKRQLNLLV